MLLYFSFMIQFSIGFANKKPPVINIAFLSGTTLVSDCGCKGEDNKITTMPYERFFIHKTVKSSHLKKLQIISNYYDAI